VPASFPRKAVKRNKYFDLEYVSLIKAIVLRALIALKIFLTRAEKRIIKNTYNEFSEATKVLYRAIVNI
jgi:hypothetical protein